MSNYKVLIALIFSVIFSNYVHPQSGKVIIKPITNADNSVDFTYTKEAVGSYIVSVNFGKLINAVTSVTKFNATADSGLLFTLKPINKNKKIDFLYTYNATQGYLNPTVNQDIIYSLPFKEGNVVKIYAITRSDMSPERWKSYLVYSRNQDTIFSMRKGTVAIIRNFSEKDYDEVTKKTTSIERKQIVIEHADGTFATYSGVEEKSISVTLGEKVDAHTQLGVMNRYNDDTFKFVFNVYYHEQDEKNKKNFRGIEVAFSPNFITQKGIGKLVDKREYVVIYNDTVRLQE
ncbi:hypothetical protein [Flavobacterium ajazii]|uniref:hypothetical protein n=1 Tax=Flavobacterium ajazii TaxID=2692318 RepID=UPI0013D41BF4|nr:hypothetical protein [Flavobacterium ajazii]